MPAPGAMSRWSGEISDLPDCYTDTLRRAVEGRERADEPDTLVIRGGIVSPARTGQGVAAELLVALRERATTAGWRRVVAPVRPTLKPRYPLTPIEEFARWTRPDGAPLDPWLRTHWRLGGRIIATAPRSQTMTGTVEEWQAWTGVAFPSTGEYVIPEGLSTLQIDREADCAPTPSLTCGCSTGSGINCAWHLGASYDYSTFAVLRLAGRRDYFPAGGPA